MAAPKTGVERRQPPVSYLERRHLLHRHRPLILRARVGEQICMAQGVALRSRECQGDTTAHHAIRIAAACLCAAALVLNSVVNMSTWQG